jgi:hypothetical protein
MTQRNSQLDSTRITSIDVPPVLADRVAAALLLVLVLITVPTGAGVGFV